MEKLIKSKNAFIILHIFILKLKKYTKTKQKNKTEIIKDTHKKCPANSPSR